MVKKFFIGCIRFYRERISPGRPPVCRFCPSCSEYAMQAISRFGAVLGLVLAMYRLLRCNPLFRGGYDPVPERLGWFCGLKSAKQQQNLIKR